MTEKRAPAPLHGVVIVGFFLLSVSLVACFSPPPNGNADSTSAISQLVRQAYSGEQAFETVAFLDDYVRWPGNRGFDASIDHIAERLEAAGYVRENDAPAGARLTYRVEEYPMDQPAWEPLEASLTILGQTEPLLRLESNRNMLATNSFSTPPGGIDAELVDGGSGSTVELDALELEGKVLMVDGSLSRAFRSAVQQRGAVGVLAYSLPDYLQPEIYRHSIQFRSIPRDESAKSWGVALSFDARERLRAALDRGPVRVQMEAEVRWTDNPIERTVVADIHGKYQANERFVFSAHVQETGANDNASGVGAQVEMARVAADLVRNQGLEPERTISFLWGDEISSTARYIRQDSVRARDVLWGVSLDMVGENAEKTGGTFLIEKMPDPSAIWTRGEESHTEWGGRPLSKEDMTPHYLNDVVLGRALEHAATNGWVVKTNPYEGGSDHVPFLRAGIPSILLWHFTDRFYHTDRDRIEMVSADELKNSGVTALSVGLILASANGGVARELIDEVREAAVQRLETETLLSQEALSDGADSATEVDIIETWASWYDAALASMTDIEVGGSSEETIQRIAQAREALRRSSESALEKIRS